MTKINKYIRVKGKEALRTGGWLTTAPVPRFQTLAPDWSTSPDMSGSAECPLSCQQHAASGKYSRKFDIRGSTGMHILRMLTNHCNEKTNENNLYGDDDSQQGLWLGCGQCRAAALGQ
ncbi:hypothetical protein T01_3599 [Trichinella spiralis]|uniref:Uncharacterized protein n=1 Tax=Trichinella spiralis TaxID=6334 RepID=A0A0V1BVZ2_TRISP|nr:hypothetical protein T01_3599 [Trichinella spiralis]